MISWYFIRRLRFQLLKDLLRLCFSCRAHDALLYRIFVPGELGEGQEEMRMTVIVAASKEAPTCAISKTTMGKASVHKGLEYSGLNMPRPIT